MKRLLLGIALCVAMPAFADISSTRPMPRPAILDAPAAPVIAPQAVASADAPGRSIRPPPRPEGIETAARNPGKGLLGTLFGAKKAVAKKPAAASVKGSVCQDPAIRGTTIPDIKGKVKGCGINNPVRVTAVDGVSLSTAATMDCDTARALRTWVTDKVKPAFGRTGITGFRVAAHYACRGRNNQKGARVSEHGRGKAIDISGFILGDGTEVSVLKHYKSSRGKAVRSAHKGACGIFGTTLGPGSDRFHADHLHLDTARYRSGPYCR